MMNGKMAISHSGSREFISVCTTKKLQEIRPSLKQQFKSSVEKWFSWTLDIKMKLFIRTVSGD